MRKMTILHTILACLFICSSTHADLIAYYPLDTDAIDATGNGHDGTIVGTGITFGQGGANANTGTSADFTANGRIDVSHSAAINSPSFTVTLWANADVAGGGGNNFRSPITNRDDVSAPQGTHGWIVYNDSGGNWNYWNGQGAGAVWSQLPGGPVTTGSWTHLAITYDSTTSTKTFYVNGASAGSANVSLSPNGPESENLHIGGGADDGSSFQFDGRIDDVSLWNNVLNPSEIQDIMNNGITLIPEPSSAALFSMGIMLLTILRRKR